MSTDSPKVAALKIRYQSSFPAKSAAIAEFEAILENEEPASYSSAVNQNFETAGDYLHKLAGSAGMYGYDDIAQIARLGMAQYKVQDLRGLQHSLKQIRDLLDQRT